MQTEQKKTDFKPETDDFDTVASPVSSSTWIEIILLFVIFQACKTVLSYISTTIKDIKTNLDGNNVIGVLQELGIRFHRVIYDHMLQFQYNTAGKNVY